MSPQVFCGAFAGFVLGSLAEIVIVCFAKNELPDHHRFPVNGASVGAVLVACIGGLAGEYELRGWLKLLSIAVLIGVVVGVLGGAFVYAPLMAYLTLDRESFFWGKEEAIYRQIGVLFGAPIGTVAGLACGIAVGLWNRGRPKAI